MIPQQFLELGAIPVTISKSRQTGQKVREGHISTTSNSIVQNQSKKQIHFNYRTLEPYYQEQGNATFKSCVGRRLDVPKLGLQAKEVEPNQHRTLKMRFGQGQRTGQYLELLTCRGVAWELDNSQFRSIYKEISQEFRQSMSNQVLAYLEGNRDVNNHTLQEEQERRRRAAVIKTMQSGTSPEVQTLKILQHLKQYKLSSSLQVQFKQVQLLKGCVPEKNISLIATIGENQVGRQELAFQEETPTHITYSLKRDFIVKKSLEGDLRNTQSHLGINIKSADRTLYSSQVRLAELIDGNQGKKSFLFALDSPQTKTQGNNRDKNSNDQDTVTDSSSMIELDAFVIKSNQDLQTVKSRIRKPVDQMGLVQRYQQRTEQAVKALEKLFSLKSGSLLTGNRIQAAEIKMWEQQQVEANKSRISEHIADVHSILALPQANVQNGYNKLKLAERGILKQKRLETYLKMLGLGSPRDWQIEPPNQDPSSYQLDPTKREFQQDFSNWEKTQRNNPLTLRTRDVMMEYLSVRRCQGESLYNKNLFPIVARMLSLVDYTNTVKDFCGDNQIRSVVIKLLDAFIKRVVPYYTSGGVQILVGDINKIRASLQQKLPIFNSKMNRTFTGLQEVATKLLSLWSQQRPDLTYRIWDIAVYSASVNDQHGNPMPYVAITYLNYVNTHGLVDVIPINNFIQKVLRNLRETTLVTPSSIDVLKDVEVKRKAVQKISKQSCIRRQLNVIDLRGLVQPVQHYLHPKTTSIEYVERFSKSPVKCTHFMLKRLKVFYNIGVRPYKLKLIHHDTGHYQEYTLYQGMDRFVFTNYYVCLQQTAVVEIVVVVETDTLELTTGRVDLAQSQLDILGKRFLRLLPRGNNSITNSTPESYCEVIYIVESFKVQSQVRVKNQEKTNTSPGMEAMAQLKNLFQGMKEPLDSFQEPYWGLKLAAFEQAEPEWILNSRIPLTEFKSRLQSLLEERPSSQDVLWRSLYQVFKVVDRADYGRVLLYSVLMSEASKEDKVSLIFKLVMKFQSGQSEYISQQSLLSIQKEIYKFYGLAEYCFPKAKIISGTLQFSAGRGEVSEARRRDITEIISAWAYTCLVSFGTMDIILGTVETLSVLKSLLNPVDMESIKSQNGCAISIKYQTGDGVYNWSANINGDFRVQNRGHKKGCEYPGYLKPNCTDSKAELLYNYQNVISLAPSELLSQQVLTKVLTGNEIINYLLSSKMTISTDKTNANIQKIHVYYDGVKTAADFDAIYSGESVLESISASCQDPQIDHGSYRCVFVADNLIYDDLRMKYDHLLSLLFKNTTFIECHFLKKDPPVVASSESLQQIYPYQEPQFGKNPLPALGIYRYQNQLQQWKPCSVLFSKDEQHWVEFSHIPTRVFLVDKHEIIMPD